MSADFRRGFDSLREEVSEQRLPVDGEVPGWLDGALLRNGPALFSVGNVRYRHWFDGLAMLHRFAMRAGEVHYSNRFLHSRNYTKVQRTGRMAYDQFATNPPRSFWEQLAATLDYPLQFGNNDLVNFAAMVGGYAALGETPTPLAIDPESLATVGRVRFSDWILGMITTAHPHFDVRRQQLFNYTTFVFPGLSSYKIFALDAGSRRRRERARISVSKPAYMHSFGATADHLILTEFPYRMHPSSMLFNSFTDTPFIRNFQWQGDEPTCFTVIEKDSGKITGRFTAPPFFAFHHINAWREGDELIADIAAYDDASIIEQTYFSHLLGPDGAHLSRSQIKRFRIPVSGTGALQAAQTISAPAFEMPHLNAAQITKPYRYVWGYGFLQDGCFNDHLIKVDVQAPDATQNFYVWHEPGCYPGEPIFVARPGAVDEDDGVVLSLVLDAAHSQSFLLILDAATLREQARLPLPHVVPFGLHGIWVGN